MTTVLVTGVTGFAGAHLLALLDETHEGDVHGTVRASSDTGGIADHRDAIELHRCDLTDGDRVREVVAAVEPDRVYHLAGQTSVGATWGRSYELLENNVVGSLNLLEAVRTADLDPRVLVVCSGAAYGAVDESATPIGETTRLQPLSPYGVSKATVDMFGYQYHRSHGLDVVRLRPFNHTGPGRPPSFALSDWAQQIARIERDGGEGTIAVGNLSAVRDFTDVRDVVRGYRLAMRDCESGEVYNVASGEGHTMEALLERLVALSPADVTIERREEKMRPVDVPRLVGDATRFEETTGWERRYALEDTLEDLMAYWRDGGPDEE